MTLTQLRYFVEVAETRSFSRVAERNFVAQAAVSYHIRTLEDELGLRLFTRSTRSVRLTPVGRGFYQDVAPILEQLGEAITRVKNRPEKEIFTIAYSRICFGERFNRMIDTLSRENPAVEFMLERAEPEDNLLERLQSIRVDAAVFFNPYPTLPPEICHEDFGVFDQTLIISEHHRLAGRAELDISEINRSELLACEGMRRIERIRAHHLHDFDNQEILLHNLDDLFAMVRAGRGATCMPVIDDVNITGLCYIPVRDPAHVGGGPTLTLAWNSANGSSVLERVRQAAAQLFAPVQRARALPPRADS